MTRNSVLLHLTLDYPHICALYASTNFYFFISPSFCFPLRVMCVLLMLSFHSAITYPDSKMFRFILALALVVSASAVCDNACSGHGTCMTDDVCKCYDNWGVGMSHDSGDCSERMCPFELAWVDVPDKVGSFHKYAECAGRGICDHGTCEYIEDMAFAATWNDYDNRGFKHDAKKFALHSWDSGKIRGCVCDAQFGDVDCSKRMCPYGNDVLDVRDDLLTATKYQQQNLIFLSSDHSISNGVNTLKGETFALTFKSRLNETFTTIPIVFDATAISVDGVGSVHFPNSGSLDQATQRQRGAAGNDFLNDVQLALLNLPNRVIDGVKVTAQRFLSAKKVFAVNGTEILNPKGFTSGGNQDLQGDQSTGAGSAFEDILVLTVTFTGDAVQGPQHLLAVEDYECNDGCTPKLTGLNLEYRYNHKSSNITETILADYNSYECGRRGKCDYDTGLCACFTGYSGDNCNSLTTLV
jgi:hypothetical protein